MLKLKYLKLLYLILRAELGVKHDICTNLFSRKLTPLVYVLAPL
jgi:hypothetical protein